MGFVAVIVAAGASSRAGKGPRKPWRPLAGRAVARWSVEALAGAGAERIVLVLADGDQDAAAQALAGIGGWIAVAGGETRALSVRTGLAALAEEGDEIPVLIHDAARPFVTARHVEALLRALNDADGAILALPLADTLKRLDAAGRTVTTPRDGLSRAQTPQAFRLGAIRRAFAAWPVDAAEPTDDAQVLEQAGGTVARWFPAIPG